MIEPLYNSDYPDSGDVQPDSPRVYVEGTENAQGQRMPYTLPFALSSRPTMRGFCASNIAGPFTERDLAVIRAGQFDSVKLRDYHDKHNILQLSDIGVRHYLGMWPDFHQGEKWQDCAEKCWQTVQRQWPYCNIWQSGNEPNDTSAWAGKPWEYANYLTAIIQYVKEKARLHGIKIYLTLPPLSYAPALWPQLDEWRAAFTQRPGPGVPALSELHDYAGANCYWEYEKYMLDGAFGMSWQNVHDWTHLPVIITEYGYSGGQTGAVPLEIAHIHMEHQYPLYVQEVARRGAVGQYVFCVGGSPEWGGFAIDVEVARAMAG